MSRSPWYIDEAKRAVPLVGMQGGGAYNISLQAGPWTGSTRRERPSHRFGLCLHFSLNTEMDRLGISLESCTVSQ